MSDPGSSEQAVGQPGLGEPGLGEQGRGEQDPGEQGGSGLASIDEEAAVADAGRVATLPVDAGRAGAVLAYLAANLVDDPDRVVIESQPGRNGGTRLSLRVAPDDMGRVIGRRGRIAQSIRGVVRAAGAGEGLDVTVDIVD